MPDLSVTPTVPITEVNSIFLLPRFPKVLNEEHTCTPNQVQITPQQLLSFLDYYRSSADMLATCFTTFGLCDKTFYLLCHRYPEVQAAYHEARRQKAQVFAAKAYRIYEDEIPAEFYEEGAQGGSKLSTAGIKYMKDKADMNLRMAKICENGSFNDRTEVASKSVNVNMNINMSPEELSKLPLDALMGLHSQQQ